MPIKRTRPKATGIPGIYQDGDNRFLIRAWFTDPKTGRQHKREGIATTLAAALVKKEELRGREPAKIVSRPRFADFAEQWLEAVAPTLAESTRDRYVTALAHLATRFGDHYVDAIDSRDVRSWQSEALKTAARPTVNGWLRVLRQVLARALDDRLITVNPAKAVKSVTEKRTGGRRGRSLTVPELRRFLLATDELKQSAKEERKKIGTDVIRMILVLVWSGMRRGEMFALKWSDYDGTELAIERSVYRGNEKATKTDDPRRVAVSGPLKSILDEQREWLRATKHQGQESGLVFPASPKHAWARAAKKEELEVRWYRSASCLDKPLRKIVMAAGVPEISPHSFRRTWENLLRLAGVDELVRRSLAGWRSEDAQEIYAGVAADERTAAVNSVAKLVLIEGGKQDQHPAPTPEGRNEKGLETLISNPSF
jgi:integrase